MTRMTVITFIMLFVIVIACGNGSTGPSGASSSSSWWPMSIGNYWAYEVADIGFTMTVVDAGITKPFADDLILIITEQSGLSDSSYFENNSSLVRRWTSMPAGPGSPSSYQSYDYLWLPLTVGKTWPCDEMGDAECISMNETVTVPAGTFENCAKISYDDGSSYGYYAQNVGLIKSVNPSYPQINMELVDYSISDSY